MLVAVIMSFLVLSLTGVAVLEVAHASKSSSLETAKNIKLQYQVESSINRALWKINIGADSLVNMDQDGVSCTWDDSTQILTVNVDNYGMETEVDLDLSDDAHFNRGIAAQEEITFDGTTAALSDEHKTRSNFNFLPEADIDYFMDNAVEVHSNSWHSWHDETLADGIHVFTGSFISLDDITINSGTLVFTGRFIFFTGSNHITAPPSDTNGAKAALVFTNSQTSFVLQSLNGEETILGAIYCKKNITLINGNISGPIIAQKVYVNENFDFLDAENVEYFQWTQGFGNKSNYDWPKQLGRWRTTKWEKKHKS